MSSAAFKSELADVDILIVTNSEAGFGDITNIHSPENISILLNLQFE